MMHEGEIWEEFKKYVHEENLVCTRRYIWRGDVSIFTKECEPDGFTVNSADNHLARSIALELQRSRSFDRPQSKVCLIQFWRAEELQINSFDGFVESRVLLTTRSQPFLLFTSIYPFGKQVSEGLCSYRMKTRDVIITGDGRGGPISRVFMNKRMETTPDVAYYSNEEYPQRDTALSCLIKSSVVVPLVHSCGPSVGVIEVVSPYGIYQDFIEDLFWSLPMNNRCKDLCGQYHSEKDLLRSDVSEIREVMDEVCKSWDIVFAQTWILCKRCNSLSTSETCREEWVASYLGCFDEEWVFWKAEFDCILQKGEGIVGKAAASSHNLVYCKDIAKFSVERKIR